MALKDLDPITLKLIDPKKAANENIVNFENLTQQYYGILLELYGTRFKWTLPKEIVRNGGGFYLEKSLTLNGACLFFYDDVLKEFLVHTYSGTNPNFYDAPTVYRVEAHNYTGEFNIENAVPILNSPYRTGELLVIYNFAKKLAQCDMTVWQNLEHQKTPYIIRCTEGQKLTLQNIVKKVNEYENAILTDNEFDIDSLVVYPLNAPFIADKTYDIKQRIWEEALNYCGISKGSQKKERVIVDEEMNNSGEQMAMLNTALATRQEACDRINDMFKDLLEEPVKVEFREDIQRYVDNMNKEPEPEPEPNYDVEEEEDNG